MTSFVKMARKASRTVLRSAVVLAGVTLMTGNAFAFSFSVQMACATDYYAHCSAYSLSSPQLRSCMRAVGTGLSKRCVNALIADGEVSAAEVSRRRGASQTAAK
jgi:quinolinate synthase